MFPHGKILRRLALVGAIAWSAAAAGCTRAHYRLQADREAGQLVRQKADDPRWPLPGFDVYADARSRYYDPYDPDRSPMPPDDPASHVFMHFVDGKRGWPYWHRDGDRPRLESPCWRERLGSYATVNSDGALELSLDSSVQAALINSPDYQQQLETIYLSALDVSTERFRFDAQFFGGIDTFFTHLGGRRLAAGEQNLLTVDSDLQMHRRFATGGELVVGLANSIVWQFAGADSHANVSLLDFNLVQPLLRAGGRAVALEQLTIVERTLLANIRAFQRYRQGFYTNVAIGELGVVGPQRRGGFFGGTGLTGFTGQGSGGFGGVGGATGFGRGGFGAGGGGAGGGTAGFAGGGAGNVGGYVGLLQQLQQIRNTQDSLNSQIRTLRLLEANLDAGLIDITQVDQFRQSIETERANLLQAEIDRENSLETFKRNTLGLPPDLPTVLDDSMIGQFQFIAPELTALQGQVADFVDRLGDLPLEPDEDRLREAIAELSSLRQSASDVLTQVQRDLDMLDQHRQARLALLEPAEKSLFEKDVARLHETFDEVGARFSRGQDEVRQLTDQLAPTTRRQTTDQIVAAGSALRTLLQEVSLIQARARLESIVMEPVQLDPRDALAIARANRLDWMNNRAALVDTWRLITFNANALLSRVDVVFSGDISTVGDNPVRFRAPTGSLRAGLRFDAPLTRLLERNNYRQVLIDYQRDRRQLIQFEDAVNQSLRQTLRRLRQLEVNLEIQRRAVAIAVRRVDQTQEALNEPPRQVEPGQPAAQLGPTAALNLLTALSDLRNSQNAFMSVWLNHYATRMMLYRELGVMEIDQSGLWVDQPLDALLACVDRHQQPLPPDVPDAWFRALEAAPDVEPRGPADRPPSAEEVLPRQDLPPPATIRPLFAPPPL